MFINIDWLLNKLKTHFKSVYKHYKENIKLYKIILKINIVYKILLETKQCMKLVLNCIHVFENAYKHLFRNKIYNFFIEIINFYLMLL